MREQVADHGGRIVKSLGDGMLAVFDGPARAIHCAEAIRTDLNDLDISVRSGVHTGECELIGDDVGGMAVHIGARVGALAEADEILVSRTVADLVVGSGLRFTDRGEHELKGIAGRWRLFAVGDPADRPVQPPGSGSTEREMRLSDRIALQIARRTARASSDHSCAKLRPPVPITSIGATNPVRLEPGGEYEQVGRTLGAVIGPDPRRRHLADRVVDQ